MNTQENNIPLLEEVIASYEKGELDLTEKARKCYLSEREKLLGKTVWVHNDELKNHLFFKQMSVGKTRTINQKK